MTKIAWDQVGQRFYETGVDHGVLYKPNPAGEYDTGVPWNGLTTVTESPEGAEATPQYADNMKYLNLQSAEDFKGTVEAFTYPDEFEECNGFATPIPGVNVGQQVRTPFGLAYRTKVGNDIDPDLGYKLHLIWNALAAPSEKAYATVNDSPEAMPLSWELSTTPVYAGEDLKPTATITIDSRNVDPTGLAALEDILFGTDGSDPRLPLPVEIFELFGGSGTPTGVTPAAPTAVGDLITIPTVTGVVYTIDGEAVTGTVTITDDTLVKAVPAAGYFFQEPFDDDWLFLS